MNDGASMSDGASASNDVSISEDASAGDGTDLSNEQPADGLMSRLSLIEDQPLDARAAAFAQLHDELQQQLEGKDSFSRHA